MAFTVRNLILNNYWLLCISYDALDTALAEDDQNIPWPGVSRIVYALKYNDNLNIF